MTSIFARKALLASGWAENVRLDIEAGCVAAISTDLEPEQRQHKDVYGIVIPGLTNAHSHAFQRVLAGHTEQRGPADKDNFWTWRNRMYSLAGKIDAPALQAIARQAYVEMVASGYTSVAEFHYLHTEAICIDRANTAINEHAMFDALVAAADASGIRMTYVPVLYERAGFDQPEPTADQRRFAKSVDDFLEHYQRAKKRGGDEFTVAIGAHSLRAVSAPSLTSLAKVAKSDDTPMHIHIAEQQREVEQSLAWHKTRPVAWLLDHYDINKNWCLVHATHMDDAESNAVARSGAVVCLCPSTEANLGDGLFRLQAYLENRGRIAIGSDSHISINPFEELRWLEYGQRLLTQSRNVAAIDQKQTGRSLFELAANGGAIAAGINGGRLETGSAADLIVLDDDNPMLVGHSTRSLIDALVFSGFSLPIDRVMIRGEWQVIEGRHKDEEKSKQAYAEVAKRLHSVSDGQ